MRLNSTSASSRCRERPPATGSKPRRALDSSVAMAPDTSAAPGTLPAVGGAHVLIPPMGIYWRADGRRWTDDPRRDEERRTHGVRGLVGTGPRIRDLGDRPG